MLTNVLPPGCLTYYHLLSNMIICSWSPTGICELCGMKSVNKLAHTLFCPCHPAMHLLLDITKLLNRQDIAGKLYYVLSLITLCGSQINSPFMLADSPLIQGSAILVQEPSVCEAFVYTRAGLVFHKLMRDLTAVALFYPYETNFLRKLKLVEGLEPSCNASAVSTSPCKHMIKIGLFDVKKIDGMKVMLNKLESLPWTLAFEHIVELTHALMEKKMEDEDGLIAGARYDCNLRLLLVNFENKAHAPGPRHSQLSARFKNPSMRSRPLLLPTVKEMRS